jgi:hypothetical protein
MDLSHILGKNMKTLRTFGLLIAAGIILITFLPFHSCEPDDDDGPEQCDTCLVVYKPNIYMYPPQTTQLSVLINFPLGGSIIASLPEYGHGWEVNVDSNGTINNKYTCLFYESIQPDIWQRNSGWIVNSDNLQSFFEDNMSAYGFYGREIRDFTDYWIPRLNKNNFYAIYPQDSSLINRAIELNFSVKPDNLLRLFYLIKGLPELPAETPSVPNNILPLNRKGFYAAEWGVITGY